MKPGGFCPCQRRVHNLPEGFSAHPGVSGGDKSFPIRFGKSGQGGRLVGENGLEWFLLIPFRMPGRLLVDPVACKHGLGIERMFDPKGAILIERGAAVCRLGVLGLDSSVTSLTKAMMACFATSFQDGSEGAWALARTASSNPQSSAITANAQTRPLNLRRMLIW